MIILTAVQADQVRGLTVAGHALAPQPLADGTFALPEACITDPAHAKYANFLKTLPVVPDGSIKNGTPGVSPSDPVVGSDWSKDTAKISANAFSSAWPAGVAIAVAQP